MSSNKITPDFIVVAEISRAIHFWIHDMGDGINKFVNGIDREFAIGEVAREAMGKARTKIIKYADHPLMDKRTDEIVKMSLYEHNGRNHVRYYAKNGKYIDHGRMIYKEIPKAGEIIAPFMGTNGPIKYKVAEVAFPPEDPCMVVYCEEVNN